jgi:hypothetical protein
MVIGWSLFEFFGGKQPAIRHLYLAAEHDQIPDDILECWATCYWCLQACLRAPVSPLTRRFKPLADLAYRLTLPTKTELLSPSILVVMRAMGEKYGHRLGVDGSVIERAHREMVEALLL